MASTSELTRLRTQVGDLVARHYRARDVRDFSKYYDDPTGFMREVLRCDPWSMQIKMAEMVRDNPRTIIVTGNGLGKDWATARIALWWAFARGGMVILTGPTERQVKQILMREVRKAFAIAPELPGELFTLELRINDSAGILAFTSDNADRLTGFHHPRLLICITEGQGVEDEAYEASLSCVTAPENRLFVYGNPTSPTGPFYRSAHSDNWETLTVNAKQHPNVITGRTEIPGSVSVEWIEMMRDEYGENSSIYQSRVLAKFPDTSIEGLIRRDWLKAAYEKHDSGELEDSTKYIPRLLALDIARYGPDKSALAYVQGPIVRELSTWHGLSVTDSANRVMDYGATLQQYSVTPTVYVDEPGLGGGAIDYFKSKGYPAEAFNGAAKPFDDRFLNARAETHWALRTLLENGLVAIPRDQALEEELLAIEWTTNIASNKIQILAKDTIRSSLGRSPDRADAVVIGLAYSTNAIRKPSVSFSPYEVY